MVYGQMIATAVDWDADGDLDLVVGDEDGQVALIENTGKLDADQTPLFKIPSTFNNKQTRSSMVLWLPNSLMTGTTMVMKIFCAETLLVNWLV